MIDIMDDYRRVVGTVSEYVAANMVETETRLAVRQTFEIYIKNFSDLGKTIDAELTRLRGDLAVAIEDRARFPDRPDMIGNMINAHYGNLKVKAETAEEHCRRLHLDKAVGIREARRAALDQAAGTHESRVTEIRSNPTSYKNGKITKSAKRAAEFHERSAQVIRALGAEVGDGNA